VSPILTDFRSLLVVDRLQTIVNFKVVAKNLLLHLEV